MRDRGVRRTALGFAGSGDQKHLALADEIGVAKIGIGVGDAGPGSAAVQLGLSDVPERLALADGVLCWGAGSSDGSWNDNLRTDFKEIRIAKTGIEGEQFLPTSAVAEVRRGKLPKGVAGLNSDHDEFPEGGRGR